MADPYLDVHSLCLNLYIRRHPSKEEYNGKDIPKSMKVHLRNSIDCKIINLIYTSQ